VSKKILLALALAIPAAAQAAPDLSGFSGQIDGGFIYARVRQDATISDSDQYVGHGAALYTFDNPGFGVQVDVSDDFYYGKPHQLSHIWSAGSSVFWRDHKGTIGFSGSYFGVDAPAFPLFGGKKSLESYGIFGEYYATGNLTLQIRGGGTEGGSVGTQSYYGAGGLTWYDSPDLAFHVESQYTSYSSGHDWTGVAATVEYMPFRFPASVYVGYDYANISHGGDSAAVYLGLKVHFDGGRNLRETQRTGPIEWTGDARPGANLRF
jgi:hypothetical protein